MKQLQAIFHGYVQGVGFRFTAEKISRQFHVTGYVRNLMDGTVEVTAEGEEKELQDFLKAIRESTLGPNILEVQANWKEATAQWRNFTIKH
jgi:acylphosphatase